MNRRKQVVGLMLLVAILTLPAAAWAQKAKLAPQSTFEDYKYRKGTKAADGRRVGVWEYFDETGQPELRFDFDANRVVHLRPDTAHYYLLLDNAWRRVRPAQPPVLLGSHAEFHSELSFTYPLEAQRQNVQGVVEAAIIIGPDGLMSDCQVVRSLSPHCDAEVLKRVKHLKEYYQWLPAQHQGQPVASQMRVWVQFTLIDSDAQPRPEQNPLPSSFALDRHYETRESASYFVRSRKIR